MGIVIGILIILFVIVGSRKWPQLRPNPRWRRLSDDEFLARCPSGINPATALRVRRVVADHFGIDYDQVDPSMSFTRDLGAY
ncbi:MAG: hypothetical protein RMJ56_08150 [Gemmataceae bacterium]|nr:hypothetical protein [Gemmataceae bacterium]